jgi:hypothetical protein
LKKDISKSSGVQVIENRPFDRIAFRWNGSIGATIYIKFNCLSTDFSRIKGVKGIPLRLQIESQQQPSMQIEKTYCRIKLFRDKVWAIFILKHNGTHYIKGS